MNLTDNERAFITNSIEEKGLSRTHVLNIRKNLINKIRDINNFLSSLGDYEELPKHLMIELERTRRIVSEF